MPDAPLTRPEIEEALVWAVDLSHCPHLPDVWQKAADLFPRALRELLERHGDTERLDRVIDLLGMHPLSSPYTPDTIDPLPHLSATVEEWSLADVRRAWRAAIDAARRKE